MRASSGPYQSLPGLSVRRHRFEVPLDHENPRAGSLVFAREVRAAGQEAEDLPWLVFLQGGPGYEAPRPTEASGWIGRAVQDHAVLLLDQRGTGLSSPLDPAHVAALGDAATQAAHMALFRADSIVADCEAIRPTVTGGAPWRILGQSFGGFCATRYLSAAPEGLSGALITGGISGPRPPRPRSMPTPTPSASRSTPSGSSATPRTSTGSTSTPTSGSTRSC